MQCSARFRAVLVALVGAGILALASPASAQVHLQWKFPDNANWKNKTIQKTNQSLTIGEMEINTGQEMVIRMATQVGTRRADGTIDVETQFESLQSKVELPFGVVLQFNSQEKVEPQGTQYDFVLDVYAALAKMQFTSTYDKNNELVEVKLNSKPFDELEEQAKAIVKDQIDPKYLAEATRQEMKIIPEKPVAVGDTWDVMQTSRLSGGQSLTITTRYSYEGTTTNNGKSLHKIGAKATKVAYEQEGESPLKVTQSDLKIASEDSYLLFDAELGQVVEQRMSNHITGDLKFEVQDAPIDGKLDLKLENSTTVE